MSGAPVYLTAEELVERYRGKITAGTLANWRSRREGPNFVKIGGKVLYATRDVISWELARRMVAAACKAVLIIVITVAGWFALDLDCCFAIEVLADLPVLLVVAPAAIADHGKIEAWMEP